jgi:hypothetical protein
VLATKDAVEKQISQTIAAFAKLQRAIETSIRNGENGWHRINVRVERGEIKQIQIQADENIFFSADGER